jgi:hypothetical protein
MESLLNASGRPVLKDPALAGKAVAPLFGETSALVGSSLDTIERDSGKRMEFRRADKFLSYVILVCGICTMGVGARQIVSSHSLVPLWDEWTEIDAIATAPHHQLPLSWLWSQHSEHRVVFYRLLLLTDVNLFHGKHWISFWCMVAVQILCLALLAWMVHFSGVRGTLWRAIVGLGGFALFCPSQWENFGWAFQISFLLPGFFLLLALSAILKYQRSLQQLQPQRLYLALSILAAGAATYSNANGIVLWPLLLLVAIALVPRLEAIASYVGFGVMFIGLYLAHYVGPSYHSSPLNSLRHPLRIFEYVAGYLGVILPAWVGLRSLVAVSSGIFGLLVALAVVVQVLWRQKREPLQIALLGLMFFALATAFLTALGRLGFGLEQAFSSRYQTFNLLFWFSTVSLVLLIADRTISSLRTLLLAAMSAAMLLAFAVFPLGLKASGTRTQQAEAAATALLTGVPAKDALGVLYDQSMVVLRDADYFRQQHLFMFSDIGNDQMGKLLSSTYRTPSSPQCQGQVTTVERIPPEELENRDISALRISGSTTDGFSGTPGRKFLIVSDDKIVGYGASVAGPFAAKHSDMVRKKAPGGWLGFARLSHDASLMDVYAVDGRMGTACHLATVEVPKQ